MEREKSEEQEPAKIGIGAGSFTKALARFVENVMMKVDELQGYMDARAAAKDLDKQQQKTNSSDESQ